MLITLCFSAREVFTEANDEYECTTASKHDDGE